MKECPTRRQHGEGAVHTGCGGRSAIVAHQLLDGYLPTSAPRLDVTAARGKARDSQRLRVYAWERAIIAPEWRTSPDVIRLRRPFSAEFLGFYADAWHWAVARFEPACAALPALKFSARMTRVAGLGGGFVRDGAGGYRIGIRLGMEGLNRAVLLHEMAHVIANGDRHGPRFCRVALDLYVQFLGVEESRALRLADEHRIGCGL